MSAQYSSTGRDGYGMVVIAALFLAFAAIAAMVLDRNNVVLQLDQQQAVAQQLSRINTALARYAVDNSNRFPCPARTDLAATDANFGVPVSVTCSTGAVPTGTVFLSGTSTANVLIRGMVPVRALIPYGITYNDAFDPWGARIMMVVKRDWTTGGAGGAMVAGDADRPEVRDYITGTLVSPRPDVVLVSYGPDRAGGTLRGGGSVTCPASTDRRGNNCTADNTFLTGPPLITSGIASSLYFDDFISTLRFTPEGTGGAAQSCIDHCGTSRTNGASWCGGLGLAQQGWLCTNGYISPTVVGGCSGTYTPC